MVSHLFFGSTTSSGKMMGIAFLLGMFGSVLAGDFIPGDQVQFKKGLEKYVCTSATRPRFANLKQAVDCVFKLGDVCFPKGPEGEPYYRIRLDGTVEPRDTTMKTIRVAAWREARFFYFASSNFEMVQPAPRPTDKLESEADRAFAKEMFNFVSEQFTMEKIVEAMLAIQRYSGTGNIEEFAVSMITKSWIPAVGARVEVTFKSQPSLRYKGVVTKSYDDASFNLLTDQGYHYPKGCQHGGIEISKIEKISDTDIQSWNTESQDFRDFVEGMCGWAYKRYPQLTKAWISCAVKMWERGGGKIETFGDWGCKFNRFACWMGRFDLMPQ